MRIGRVASLVLSSALAGGLVAGPVGCSTPDSGTDLHPEGAPEVLQVFVTERTTTSTALGLAYNGNPDYDLDEKGGGADSNEPNGCGDIFDENGDDCAVTKAVADASQKIRIVFDELLDGSTVEEFFCACAGTSGDDNCPNNVVSSIDPSLCDDNPDTDPDEGSRWLDLNNDGMPDRARLVSGIVTVNCDGVDLYSSKAADGFYNPSGNQLVPVATGLGGLGPALVISASAGLKTNAECKLKLSPGVRDKEGESVPDLMSIATLKFHSEDFTLLTSTPGKNATNVSPDLAVSLLFNAFLAKDTTVNVVLREKGGTTSIDGKLTADGSTVKIDPTGTLRPDREYEVTIPKDTLTDLYGGKFPGVAGEDQLISFKTGPFKLLAPNPADKKVGVALNQIITLKMNVTLDPATLGQIVLRKKSDGTVVTTTVAIDTADANSATAKITPSAALEASTVYEIVIPTTLLGAQGDAFPAEKITTFTTGT